MILRYVAAAAVLASVAIHLALWFHGHAGRPRDRPGVPGERRRRGGDRGAARPLAALAARASWRPASAWRRSAPSPWPARSACSAPTRTGRASTSSAPRPRSSSRSSCGLALVLEDPEPDARGACAGRGAQSVGAVREPLGQGVAQQHHVAELLGSRPAAPGGRGATGSGPRPTKRRAPGSPTKNGATTSCSSSTRSSARNWVCTAPPPSTISRRTPRACRSLGEVAPSAPGRPRRRPRSRRPSRAASSRRRRGCRRRPACRLPSSAKKRCDGSSRPRSVTVTLTGCSGRPRSSRAPPAVGVAHQQPRVVVADRGGADQDRVDARRAPRSTRSKSRSLDSSSRLSVAPSM